MQEVKIINPILQSDLNVLRNLLSELNLLFKIETMIVLIINHYLKLDLFLLKKWRMK